MSREEAVAQIRAVCAELTELHRRCPGRSYGVLLDTTTATTVPTPNDLLRVLDEIGAHGDLPATTRWAVFATKPVHYGMGRLFQAHAETRGVQVRVFATRESALVWLTGASSGPDVARDGEAEE